MYTNTHSPSCLSSKSTISVPCWCWPVQCPAPESTRWTWRWCQWTPCSATTAVLPSDSPSTLDRTLSKEGEEQREDWNKEKNELRGKHRSKKDAVKRSCLCSSTSHCDVKLSLFIVSCAKRDRVLSDHHISCTYSIQCVCSGFMSQISLKSLLL